MRKAVCVAMLLCLSCWSRSFAAAPAVEFFSPQGEVKGVRQVTARFSEQMVAFGDPRLRDPFDIHSPVPGKGRWVDGKNWVFDFDTDLPAGLICEFTLKSDLKSVAGRKIEGGGKFVFSTGGPAIRAITPYEGATIDEEQAFILYSDADAKEESVLAHLFCDVEGIGSPIGMAILKGEDREKILKAEGVDLTTSENAADGSRASRLLLVRCQQRFPNGVKVTLVWGKGIASATGVETSADQKFSFTVREPFQASFRCDRVNAKADCTPILPFSLRFSSPVPRELAEKIVMKGPGDTLYRPKLFEEGEPDPDEAMKPKFVDSLVFPAVFSPLSTFSILLPEGLTDDAGRPLANADQFPLTVRTADYPPLAKFAADFGIIESSDPVLPVTLRNIEVPVKTRMLDVDDVKPALTGTVSGKTVRVADDTDIIRWLSRVESAKPKESLFTSSADIGKTTAFSLPKPSGKMAFEVVGIPLKAPGFHIVEIESRILGEALLDPPKPYFVSAAALVTNLSVHFKQGRESSLVWVTRLDTAAPVKDARISIRDCTGKSLWEGSTDANGIANVMKPLPDEDELPRCENYGMRGYWVFARSSVDMAFVRSIWDNGIESWRFNLPYTYERGSVIAHTILDRSLLRAGETVSMKHLIRNHTMAGFSHVAGLPRTVSIRHRGSQEQYELPLSWNKGGVAETGWNIPRDAKLGTYDIVLQKKSERKGKPGASVNDDGETGADSNARDQEWTSGTFRVEEFRVPLMKAMIQPPKEALVNVQEAPVDLQLRYLAGGGASGAQVKLRTLISPQSPRFAAHDGFIFTNGAVKEGIRSRSEEMADEAEDETAAEPPAAAPASGANTRELVLDKAGALRTVIDDLPRSPLPLELQAEMEFRDPNGEIQTVSERIPLWPSHLLMGIKVDAGLGDRDAFKIELLVTDLAGKPVPNRRVSADLLRQKIYSHRKRLIGGFYAYEHATEIKKIGRLLEGTTDENGRLSGESRAPVSGNLIVQAQTDDDAGNRSIAHCDFWMAGKGDYWFDVSDNDRIDLLPEKKSYEPGEIAKFQVRMPFREATALVTVEREGVMEAFITHLSGKSPVVAVPVKGNYAPNAFVSVLCVRGRVGDPKPTALVDLGRPAYKLGISEIRVGWSAHELQVSLSADKPVYPIRDKATVHIKVTNRGVSDSPLPKNAEVAVAAVDEGLLELMPNKSWKLLDAMMGRRAYEVQTFTAQMQVVGKRHYGLKAFPQGGGGGKAPSREMFDTLLLWKARVRLDDRGEASVRIPLNDSLTSFRIAAMATAGTGLFGSGETSIRTSQDLMLLSGLSPVVREGDEFRAGFTVRNASAREMTVTVSATVVGAAFTPEPRTEHLGPGQAREVFWNAVVPANAGALTWEVVSTEKDGPARDRLKITQKVVAAVPERVRQATMLQVDGPRTIAVEKPAGSIEGKGGVTVSFRDHLAGGMSGVTAYLKAYPFSCMEQKLSRAIGLKDESLRNAVLAELPAHLDADGLVKYFATCRQGSDCLTAYLLSITHEAGWQIPENLKTRMIAGLTGFISGRLIRDAVLATADLSIRRMAAFEALSRYGAADPKLLDAIAVEPQLWPTSALIDWMSALMRVSGIAEREKRLTEAAHIISSRLYVSGTTLGFSTEKTDYLWWLMVSGDVNAVRVILTFLELNLRKEDMPRLVKAAIGRQKNGAWSSTPANAWGILAMDRFSKQFEKTAVSGRSSATLGDRAKPVDWKGGAEKSILRFDWPGNPATLTLDHQGAGAPWAMVQSLAAIAPADPVNSGYTIQKTLTPIEQQRKDVWSAGDVIRVTLDLDAAADMTWVVVNDPIPAGAAILGGGLGGDSKLLTKDEKKTGWTRPVFTERSATAYRAYYDYVPKGKWAVTYSLRLNTSGLFSLPETRVEALYAPEMFGELPNKGIKIDP